jgi:subtilase family serine protease
MSELLKLWGKQVVRRSSGIALASVFLFAATAHAGPRAMLTSHVPAVVSNGQASRVGALPGTQRLSLAISLPLRDEAGLDRQLQQLYDPQSPQYHQYLSVQEFTQRFGPTQDDYDAAIHFAEGNGLTVDETHANRMVLDVEGDVTNVEKALHVSMGVYRHPTENRTFYAPDREPTLDLDVPVLHISGLDNSTLPQAKFTSSKAQGHAPVGGTGSGPDGQFIGSDMRAAYYGSGSLTGAGQTIGLFELTGYEVSDVQLYFETVNEPLNVPIYGVSLNGKSLGCGPPTCSDVEAALDIEMAISMVPGLRQVLVYVGTSNVSIFDRMASDNVAKQLSCSWGWADNRTSLNPIFKEFAAQGQTLFVATGDDGSGTPANVVWPSDDPYVTAVGGTDLVTSGAGGPWLSETGWQGSAGGASKNAIPIPPYQEIPGVINALNEGSTTLRNYPDVASESNTNQFSCFDGGCGGQYGGTSYAAPQWAGFIAMMNEQRIDNGKSAVGFLNTALYGIGTGSKYDTEFHDTTSGTNGGYSCVTGYDLVTGWGSLNAGNFLNALAKVK